MGISEFFSNVKSKVVGAFSFKNAFAVVFSADNINEFFSFVRGEIVDYVAKKDLLGEEKKKAVDAKAIEWVELKCKGENGIIDWIVDHILIPLVPELTQRVYDFLKEFVQDLTK